MNRQESDEDLSYCDKQEKKADRNALIFYIGGGKNSLSRQGHNTASNAYCLLTRERDIVATCIVLEGGPDAYW